jgi:hypothetical protein
MADVSGFLSSLQATYYSGVLRVPLHLLSFDLNTTQEKHRSISKSKVRPIETIFARVGCSRLLGEPVVTKD